MRRRMIAANWKMNTSGAEADALARAVRERLSTIDIDIILCPPFLWLDRVSRILAGSSIKVGAQDVFWENGGAYTGEISPIQLAEVCEYVIVGHSERRNILCESDDVVGRKLRAASAAGLTPILAVGENRLDHDRSATREVVTRQLRSALAGGWEGELVLAYEPVWAIGTGIPATPEHAGEVARTLRTELAGMDPKGAAVRILYGGSVRPGGLAAFLRQPDIDGALVGGASLKIEEFARLANEATV